MRFGHYLFLVVCIVAGVQTWRLSEAQHDLTRAQLARSAERLAAANSAIRTLEAYAERTAALQATVDQAEATHAKTLAALADRDRRLADNDRRVHDRIATLAAARDAAADTVAACRADAATLGDLLARYRAAGRRAAVAAERHAAEVATLLASWPPANACTALANRPAAGQPDQAAP